MIRYAIEGFGLLYQVFGFLDCNQPKAAFMTPIHLKKQKSQIRFRLIHHRGRQRGCARVALGRNAVWRQGAVCQEGFGFWAEAWMESGLGFRLSLQYVTYVYVLVGLHSRVCRWTCTWMCTCMCVCVRM